MLGLTAVAVGPTLVRALDGGIDEIAAPTSRQFEPAARVGGATPTDTLPPPPTTTPTTTTAPSPTGTSNSIDVQAVLDRTNTERAQRGAAPLQLHPQLNQAAEAHAADQFNRGCNNLSHTGTDGSSPFDRIERTGLQYRAAAENIACGYGSPAAVMDGWMNSSGHRANILNSSYTHIGISATIDANGRPYWVQVFATPT